MPAVSFEMKALRYQTLELAFASAAPGEPLEDTLLIILSSFQTGPAPKTTGLQDAEQP